MSYAALLSEETETANFLAVIRPRREASGWSVVSGSVYSTPWALGLVSGLWTQAEDLTEASSSALAAGEWFYDPDAQLLYARLTSGADPDTVTMVAEYRIFMATTDVHWHMDPTDAATREVYFPALINKSPVIKENADDATFGFLPIQSTSITITNALHELEEHLYGSSFNKAPVELYLWLSDTLDVANFKKVFDGRTDKPSYGKATVQLNIFSRTADLSTEYRNAVESFYSLDDFPDMDVQAEGYPIRYVYGVVDNFRPVNLDFVSDSPTTSDNRVWGVIGEQDVASVVRVVASSPSSTTTRTYLTSVAGLRAGDTAKFIGGGTAYAEITAVGANCVDHTAIGSPLSTGNTVERSFIGFVCVVQDNVVYKALYGRDYTVNVAMAAGVSGFEFTTSMESNLSIPSTLSSIDRVYCRVYGPDNNQTLGGNPIGIDDASTANMAHAVPIMVDLLKRVVGVPDAEINATTFAAVDAVRRQPLGIAIPDTYSGSMPAVKDVITTILKSSLVRIFTDSDLLYSAVATGPMGAADYQLSSDEILKDTFDYDFDHADLASRISVRYGRKETSDDPLEFGDSWFGTDSTSEVVPLLHLIDKETQFDTYLVEDADAQVLADRLLYYLGAPSQRLSVAVGKRFFEVNIGDVIEISRAKMPGYAYDKDVLRTRKFSVVGVSKSLRQVNLTLDDQKGIEDNNLSW